MRARSTTSLAFLFVVVTLSFGPAADAAYPRPLHAKRGMVVSADRRASEAGVEMLRRGGNAVDAAVATAFAISVTEPYSAGIGGGGFLLLHLEKRKKLLALDFRERAPLAATRDMYLDEEGKVREGASTDGYLSVAVPGTVAGLYEVHQRYGKLPWAEVVAPAIRLADEGIWVDEVWVAAVEWRKKVLLRHPAARALFTKDGAPHEVGDLVVQRDLAATLRRIAQDPSDFYTGRTAKLLVEDMKQNGGLITAEDLRTYRPTWRRPVCGTYRAYRVCSMPPPSSGGVHLVQMLNLLEPYDLGAKEWHHVDTIHLLVEAMRIAYADRAVHLGDPAFHEVPVRALISAAYADVRRKEIDPKKARRSSEVRAATKGQLALAKESADTSHLAVVDEDRNAVSLTFTVNYGFGSGVVVPGTGVLLNDEMDDFSVAPGVPNAYGLVGGEANAIAPAKIPLSSMSPTVVTKDGALKMALGSSGGSTIITTVLQVFLNVVDHAMDAGTAVAAPRLHHQWLPDVLRLERFGFDPLTNEALRARGHEVEERDGWGNANLIVVLDDGRLQGAADPRGSGAAAGY